MSAAVKFPVGVPSLDLITSAPDCLDQLPYGALTALKAKAAATLAVIESAQLLAINRADRKMVEADDEMLTEAEAAKLIRRSSRWIWKNKHRLPFVRHISSRSMLCSKNGIEKWLAKKS